MCLFICFGDDSVLIRWQIYIIDACFLFIFIFGNSHWFLRVSALFLSNNAEFMFSNDFLCCD